MIETYDPGEQFLKERATLVALLLDMPLGLPLPVAVADLETKDKLFLLCTCCAQMIAEALWAQAGGDVIRAQEGLDALVVGIKDNLRRPRDRGRL
jgi:hypothetical protein